MRSSFPPPSLSLPILGLRLSPVVRPAHHDTSLACESKQIGGNERSGKIRPPEPFFWVKEEFCIFSS